MQVSQKADLEKIEEMPQIHDYFRVNLISRFVIALQDNRIAVNEHSYGGGMCPGQLLEA